MALLAAYLNNVDWKSLKSLDFYINGSLNWGIEVLMDGSEISEHFGRFDPGICSKYPESCGAYTSFNFGEKYVVVDFRKRPVHNVQKFKNRLTFWFADDYAVCDYQKGFDAVVHDVPLCP
jgi:hypothetical protein